jgi:hypothetical protein
MRNQMKGSRLSMVLAVAMGVLAMTFGANASAATDQLAVKNVSVSGGIVLVTVKNVSLLPVVSTVAVEAVCNDTAVWSLVPVAVLPGQSVTVSAAFTGAVTSVKTVAIKAGIADNGVPI